MNIVMHCGGIPFNGDSIKNMSLGGSESAAYYMARELSERGHDVKLFTNTAEGGVYDNVKYIPAGRVTENAPLGESFEFYARQTPHDVLIIQRHPQAFSKLYASKVNILWLHDLASHRQKDGFLQQMWNVDAVFCVSEFHKDQVCDVYGIKPDVVHVVRNGVDEKLFSPQSTKTSGHVVTLSSNQDGKYSYSHGEITLSQGVKYLIYSSRPERGLNHLVREGGIMERLAKEAPECHLLVCGYDNTTPQMLPLYQHLWSRCDALDNVTNIGALTKFELAQLMNECYLHVYPTEFEEVSCITAMEAATAGLVLISSNYAALPETCDNGGVALIDLKDGHVCEDEFLQTILNFIKVPVLKDEYSEAQKIKSEEYEWGNAASIFESATLDVFCRGQNRSTILKHFMRHSDIVAMRNWFTTMPADAISGSVLKEFNECYGFLKNDSFGKHYEDYYEYEKERGVNYGPENLSGNNRFEYVSNYVADLPDKAVVLDYGCAHGHYTINLAKRFPHLRFIGVDIAKSNIEKAREWSKSEELENVDFFCTEAVTLKDVVNNVDCILACEVLEHVGDVNGFLDDLLDVGTPKTTVIITVPYGPWESQGYQEHWPWRAHLYEFGREDLRFMFSQMDDYSIGVAPSGAAADGTPLGSYVVKFTNNGVRRVYAKVETTIPRRGTVTLAMIAKDAQSDIERCLKSALPIVDEVIIGVDVTTTDNTIERAVNTLETVHCLPYKIVTIDSPLETGFDAARNVVIEQAAGDWILWLDSDEELHNAVGILPFLRNNMYDGYAIQQHHISANPPGILKTDTPCKLFRNQKGIKFYGVVHEHPEEEIGKGVEHTMVIGCSSIMHHGYPDEAARRGRFKRNLELLARDREEYPQRTLGKFLWLRDLAQMNQFEFEQTGVVTNGMMSRSEEAVVTWRELVDENLRMAVESLPFYSSCVRLLGVGFEMSMSLDTNLVHGAAKCSEVAPIEARFYSEDHANYLQQAILHERVKNYESRYF